MDQGFAKEAITHFQKAIELQPDYSDAYNNIGAAIIEKTKPIVEEMQVSSDDGRLFTMEASSYTRFDAAITAFVALDTDQAVGLYKLLSPLLQQAYAEIGFRDAEFEQALIKAIDAVLSAPEIEGPFQLVKPSVMYLYADTRLEELANMNKQLIRLGPENSARLKAKLREFKQAL